MNQLTEARINMELGAGILNPDCPGVILILANTFILDNLFNFSVIQFSHLSSGDIVVPGLEVYCGN